MTRRPRISDLTDLAVPEQPALSPDGRHVAYVLRTWRNLPLTLQRRRGRTGGAEEIRTPDLRRAKAALSQLSYGPRRVWWAMVDSNHRPRSYQDRALTS